ncbi:TolB family protein [Roseovarius phycicola]
MPQFSGLIPQHNKIDLHYLNAAKLSATGERFSVLYKTIPSLEHPHTWNVNAVVGTLDGKELQRVPLPGNASHYWWIDDDRIVYTSNKGRRSDYLVYNCQTETLTPLTAPAPSVDGHPSLHVPTGRWATDTYPDLCGEQHLYVLSDDMQHRLGQFKASTRYSDECRCDLHPRWSRDGKSIFFDSTHNGSRAIYRIACDEAGS